jgi:hypothetical protein
MVEEAVEYRNIYNNPELLFWSVLRWEITPKVLEKVGGR